jgi:tetratricopeptide (TPR) repeat protein
MRPFLALTLACLALTTAVAAEAQGYRTLVDDYRRYGAAAVRKAVTLTDDQIAEGRHQLANSWEDQRAAAMLHTEAMIVLANDEQLPAATRHLDVAVSLLDEVVKASPPQQDFAYRWFTVTESLLRQYRASASANALRGKARDRFPEAFLQARAWFDDAVVFEVQGCRQGATLSAQALGKGGGAQLPSRWFLPAARLFQNVLDKDPAFLTPALHLGRLNMLEGRLDDAAAFFERALAAVDPRVRYLARLFLGSLDERADRLADAEKRYRAAMAEYPWGQSAQLALAQVLSRTGRDGEARALLLDRFGKGDRLIEPLWTYAVMPNEEMGARFDELRAEVWR